MSSSQLARNRTVSMSSALSSKGKGRAANIQDFTMSPGTVVRHFDPCAATASMFLYAQGPSVVCCHHDTLTIERRFSRHSEEVQLLAVDTQSELGNGRLVVSYDAGQTAIVWDLMTGDEVARFASYEHLTVAAWMRNGNVAFGNTQGNIILFEPTTSEHISARTIDQIAVTALAPAADCRTFAIGYQNGSLIIATLQPRFTILHNLSISRAPSPIVTLAWHASSSRQKSDMLAAQTLDGDLRVWSVSKAYSSNDPAKVVRILKKNESAQPGPNWMSWSKNGRIIQFSESETLSWDVRTKHVTYDSIPTLETIRGLAVYGPGASLFTLGANNTVQQFDLNSPSVLVANVQHPANLLPPSPPVSIEEQQERSASTAPSESEGSSVPILSSESEDDRMSPIARIVHAEREAEQNEYRSGSPGSSRSSVSKSSTSSRTPAGRYPESVRSRGMSENTYISSGSSMRSSAVPPYQERRDRDSFSMGSISSASITSSSRSRHRPSRLRHEVPRSPDDAKVTDLFKYTRTRLSDIPYKRPPSISDNSRLTNDDLRRQMLSTIFGWNKEIDDLVRDELSRHPAASASRILLSKWLGDIDPDILATSSENMTSSDWMLLALSGIGGKASQQKLARAYIQRLLESGDVHAAATIMIGFGDYNDAIEIYVSHKRYMEALILTCLFYPSVWERQSQIIKKWGEWAVLHGQQQLAIRCFACTGKESSEPWTSPSAAQIQFQNITPSIPEVLSPPLSPPTTNHGPQRSIAKTSALKLITSFSEQGSKSKFFSTGDGGATPIAAGVTPIAESAVSPGGHDVTTAFLRPSQRSAFNTPSSARRDGPGPFSRQRLPSIGEAPNDAKNRAAQKGMDLPTPPVDASGNEDKDKVQNGNHLSVGISVPRAATASPMMMRSPRMKDAPLPSPSPESMAVLMGGRGKRNGSRRRMPDGLTLQLQSIDDTLASDVTSPEQSVASSAKFHWPSRRRGPGSVASSATSASSAHRGHRQRSDNNGKSLDEYIHSLDAAKTQRQSSRDGRSSRRDASQNGRGASRERSEERGRSSNRSHNIKPAKRSPTSPIPMSPEDLINLGTPNTKEPRVDDEGMSTIDFGSEPSTVRRQTSSVRRADSSARVSSRQSSQTRHRSRDRRPPALTLDARGRTSSREGSTVRSPSSPLPMSAQAAHYYGSEDEEDYRRAVEDKARFRSRAGRSSSRVREPISPDVRETRDRSQSRPRGSHSETRRAGAGDLKRIRDERQAKKEAAARELEERRKSLARRPAAPLILHPDDLSPSVTRSPMNFELPSASFSPPRDIPSRSNTVEPGAMRSMYANRGPVIGLPATPKAMRLVLESDSSKVPGVPAIPSTFAQRMSPTRSAGASPKDGEISLTLLPSTVYSPPARPPIHRSMSCPPEEPVAIHSRGGSRGNNSPREGMTRGQSLRRNNTDHQEPSGRKGSYDSRAPPPPPMPPMLKELQHLAMPPPPPPPPLPPTQGGLKPTVYGGSNKVGNVEIVMDDDDNASIPVAAPASEATVPIIAPPAPPQSRGHQRGRSSTDNSISARISKATERFRSASRSRNTASLASRTKSPIEVAPYESVPPPPPPPPMGFQPPRDVVSPIHQQQAHEFRTGLHQSEMI